MVLDSTTREGGFGPSDATEEQLVNERSAAIFKLCGICGPDNGTRKPLRIVVVGKHGGSDTGQDRASYMTAVRDRY